MELKLREAQDFIPSHTVNLWLKESLTLAVSSSCARQPLCPVLAPEDCVTGGKICVEVRKPNQWARPPKLPLTRLHRCICFTQYWVKIPLRGFVTTYNCVVPGNCLPKEHGSWGTEAFSRWFAHIWIFSLAPRNRPENVESFVPLWTPSSLLAFFDSVQIKMSDGKENSPSGFQALMVTLLAYCCSLRSGLPSCRLPAFQVTFLRRDPLKNAGLIMCLPCKVPFVTLASLRKKSEPLNIARKTS